MLTFQSVPVDAIRPALAIYARSRGRRRGAPMIKSHRVARLPALYPHLYPRDVERIVTTVLDSITKALATGHRVELRGFGAFSVKTRPSRMGRNPRTGEPVSVGQKRAPFFRTGKELRERLNITKAPE